MNGLYFSGIGRNLAHGHPRRIAPSADFWNDPSTTIGNVPSARLQHGRAETHAIAHFRRGTVWNMRALLCTLLADAAAKFASARPPDSVLL